jgi:histidyl-tRNA synthetase
MKSQPPKGTRDFYPPQMALRNYLVDAWQRVSIRNGYEQVEGPIFESLDLYKVKSGDAIVSELFHFEDRGERELAIRPEFTPTLARMVAAQANALPRPIKWFCTPNLCRAERPQRGRLREFLQWNCDILGIDSPVADAECIFTAIDLLMELGLKPDQVKVRISHRQAVHEILVGLGVPTEKIPDAFNLLDQRGKITPEEFTARAGQIGLEPSRLNPFQAITGKRWPVGALGSLQQATAGQSTFIDLQRLDTELQAFGIADWCEYDLGIVRGLAYYTGTVFEIHETTGALRAMAGGGRYDKLIELFGGPSLPAMGFGMGDVVLAEVLADRGLIPTGLSPRPDAFVIAASDAAATRIPSCVASLRRHGLHVRFSYKSTRNLGKLFKDAASLGAPYVVILDDKTLNENQVSVKALASGEQVDLTVDATYDKLVEHLAFPRG